MAASSRGSGQRKSAPITEARLKELDKFAEKIKSMVPSAQQEAIFAKAQEGRGHYIIKSGPGTGKTTTAIKLSTYLPRSKRSIYFVYNKKIQLDSSQKLRRIGSKTYALTLHAFGKRAIEASMSPREMRIEREKYSRIVREYTKPNYEAYLNGMHLSQKQREELEALYFDVNDWIKKLIHYAFASLTPPEPSGLANLVEVFDLDVIDTQSHLWSFVTRAVERCMEIGQDEFYHDGILDFDEMIFYPATNESIPVSLYDVIMIDEAQDLTRAQLQLVRRICHERSQVFAIGDPLQSIYAFAGADANSFYHIRDAFGMQELPLLNCYRCATHIVDLANQLGGSLAPERTLKGIVGVIDPDSYLDDLKAGDAVLSRTTAPLVEACLKCLRLGKRAIVIGRDIGENITGILKRIEEMRPKPRARKKLLEPDLSNFLALLGEYHATQLSLLQARPESDKIDMAISELADKVSTVEAFFISYLAKCLDASLVTDLDPKDCLYNRSIDDLKEYITRHFTDDPGSSIQFLTAHRAKGLEYECVYIITTHLFPHPKAKSEQAKKQERNLMYVAVSRAMDKLYFVGEPFRGLRLPGRLLPPAKLPTPEPVDDDLAWLDVLDESINQLTSGVVEIAHMPAPAIQKVPLEDIPTTDELSPTKKDGRGRPRKAGKQGQRRVGLEISIDTRIYDDLKNRTGNRSGYIERLIIEDMGRDPDEEWLRSDLEARYQQWPPEVIKKIREIREVHGTRAAYEASEAMLLLLEHRRS